ncbi:hypothetical protein L7F22_022132 [Adiantum nelumboides]|nr:hypothetical protein [Adiantum nelumboides]
MAGWTQRPPAPYFSALGSRLGLDRAPARPLLTCNWLDRAGMRLSALFSLLMFGLLLRDGSASRVKAGLGSGCPPLLSRILASGVYLTAAQMGCPSQSGLLTPPWHNTGFPPMQAAMVPTPAAPGATPMAPTPPLSSPLLYPFAPSIEPHNMSTTSQSQKQFPACHGFGNPKEHIFRMLLISGIPAHISEARMQEELEWWGAIRGIQADAHPQGLQVKQNESNSSPDDSFALHGRKGVLCGSVVSAQYIGSWGMAVPDAHNQGHAREVREAPAKRRHKFVEFYDIRAAAAAWNALNGKEIRGKCVKIEFSRQGGAVARRQKTQHEQVLIGKAHRVILWIIIGMGMQQCMD